MKTNKQFIILAALVCNCCLGISCDERTSLIVGHRGMCGSVVCEDDEICVKNACVRSEDLNELEDIDPCQSLICNEGEVCVDGECEVEVIDEYAGTCGGKDCFDDEVCIADICVKDEPVPTENVCGDEVCLPPKICVDNSCIDSTRVVCGDFVCNEGQICNEVLECVDDVGCEGESCEVIEEQEQEPDDPAKPVVCGDKTCEIGESCDEEDGECVAETMITCGDEKCVGDEICDETTHTCVEVEEVPEVDDPVVIEPVVGAFLVTPTSGITTTRSGEKGEFTITLDHEPDGTISVPVKSLKTQYGTVSPTSVKFTKSNWSTPKTITVTGTTDQTLENKKYKIQVGPISGDDKIFKDAEMVIVNVTHIDDIVKEGTCSGGKNKDDAGKCISVPVTGIKLSSSSVRVLRGSDASVTATVVPENASNKDLTWTLVKSSRSDEKASDVVAKNVSTDTSTATFTSKIKGARTVTVRVKSKSNTSISKEFSVNVKPYVSAKFGSDSDSGYRNYHFTKGGYGDLSCRYYGEDSAIVFNQDLYKYYVSPKMAEGSNGKKYGTRASVVAAARFLTLRFPYDIPYYMGTISKTAQSTRSHYIWTENKSEKASNVNNVRIYGLNLRNNVYNSYECKSGNYSDGKGDVIKTDGTPWGCTFEKDNVKTYNGLECSGFVTWAFRNGHLSLGDWKTHLFANYKDNGENHCGAKSDNKRNFRCSSYINGLNPNNAHESVYSKLKNLKESDFLLFGSITKEQQKLIKAGDIVWHGLNSNISSGHVALILGIKRNSDNTIKDIYIAEATGGNSTENGYGKRSGNSVRHYTWSELMSAASWVSNGKKSYIIKMGNVYNYYTDYSTSKQYFQKDGKQIKDSDGKEIHGDTYKYYDMW